MRMPRVFRVRLTRIMRYAFWKGIMDVSTSDMPVLLNADTDWNAANLKRQRRVRTKRSRQQGSL